MVINEPKPQEKPVLTPVFPFSPAPEFPTLLTEYIHKVQRELDEKLENILSELGEDKVKELAKTHELVYDTKTDANGKFSLTVELKEKPKPPPRTNYTREELIEICEKATQVQYSSWRDRDSARSTLQLGQAWALLKAGCDFSILQGGSLNTDHRTIWLQIDWPGFSAFEYGRNQRQYWEDDTFYLPAPERLEGVPDKDWY